MPLLRNCASKAARDDKYRHVLPQLRQAIGSAVVCNQRLDLLLARFECELHAGSHVCRTGPHSNSGRINLILFSIFERENQLLLLHLLLIHSALPDSSRPSLPLEAISLAQSLYTRHCGKSRLADSIVEDHNGQISLV